VEINPNRKVATAGIRIAISPGQGDSEESESLDPRIE
jgi:hypothetical protein